MAFHVMLHTLASSVMMNVLRFNQRNNVCFFCISLSTLHANIHV